MSKRTLYLIGILVTILIGTYFYWKLCCSFCCDTVQYNENIVQPANTKKEVDIKIATGNEFVVSDAVGDFNYSSSNNFDFNSSEATYLEPLSDGVRVGIDTLKTYFSENPTKYLNITGWYTSEEENKSAFPNLGIARANSIKNYLVSSGFPSNKINTLGAVHDDMVLDKTTYRGPVSFGIKTVDDTLQEKETEEMNALRDRIRNNPLVLHFNSGATSITLSETQRKKFADISTYLDKVTGATIKITGHTDNTGSGETNFILGKKRTEFAKAYFTKNGIDATKIKTISRGPDDPIASNNTEAGRSKNRRTVITIN